MKRERGRTQWWVLPVFEVLVLYSACMIGWAVPIDAVSAEKGEDPKYRLLRERMVREQISEPPDCRMPITTPVVLQAMRTVPRHLFVNPGDLSLAYSDSPLPIGFGQTISQPYIVALMTDLLDVRSHYRVLEVGTGSGYQAAILSGLVKEVYTIEIVQALGRKAADRLRHLGYDNVHVRTADGYFGWEEHAPFDRIIVTCAATLVPPPLLKQLLPGGIMCIPVGGPYETQFLTLIRKSEKGDITMQKKLPVLFVPLTRTLK